MHRNWWRAPLELAPLEGQFVRSRSGGLLATLRRWATPLALVVLLIAAGVVPMSYANWTELSTAPDEAAHYVTSLMIRTYATEALGSNPRTFAEQYYLPYPKVAFGIWPPLFHLSLAGWLLLTGPSFTSALAFVVLTTVLVCVTIYLVGRRLLGIPLALVAAVWFVTFPTVQISATSVMMDMLCALFMLQAAYAFGRYLDQPRARHAWHFGLAAAAGLLTKYNAGALALVPPLAMLLCGRWRLLRRPDFWLMPVIVAALTMPWYLTHLDMVRYASEPIPPPGAWVAASQSNLSALVVQLGRFGWPLVLVGAVHALRQRAEPRGPWVAMIALLCGVWTFHSLLYPIVEPRYLLAPLAALALLGAAGVRAIAIGTPALWRVPVFTRVRIAAAIFLVIALATWTPRERPGRGFSEAAAYVVTAGLPTGSTTLVSADPIGEGAYVAYLATHVPRHRDALVLRASKLLSRGTWMGLNYSLRVTAPADVLSILDEARVEYVVLDDSSEEPHHLLLDRTVSRSPSWQLVATPSRLKGHGVRIYDRVRPLPPGTPHFELDTMYSLGRNISR